MSDPTDETTEKEPKTWDELEQNVARSHPYTEEPPKKRWPGQLYTGIEIYRRMFWYEKKDAEK